MKEIEKLIFATSFAESVRQLGYEHAWKVAGMAVVGFREAAKLQHRNFPKRAEDAQLNAILYEMVENAFEED